MRRALGALGTRVRVVRRRASSRSVLERVYVQGVAMLLRQPMRPSDHSTQWTRADGAGRGGVRPSVDVVFPACGWSAWVRRPGMEVRALVGASINSHHHRYYTMGRHGLPVIIIDDKRLT